MQPTGALHIGNLEGALRNWVASGQLLDVLLYRRLACSDGRLHNTGVLKERISR
jgi:hypothetical protein